MLNAERAARARYYSGAASRRARNLPLSLRLRDLNAVCRPAFSCRCGWWQFSETLATRVGRFQRKPIGGLMRLQLQPGETWAKFRMRRGQAASAHVRQMGSWPVMVAQRVVSWSDHVNRNHNASWPGFLVKFMGSRWFQARRLMNGSASVFAGRTATRS